MNLWYTSNSRVPSRNANSIHVMQMCQAYASLGHKVTLLVPRWKIGIEPGVDDIHVFYGVRPDFRIMKVPLAGWKKLDLFHRGILMPLIASMGKPDLVHSRSLTAAWGGANLFRIPTVLEIHQPINDNSKRQKLFYQTLSSNSLRGVVVITQALARRLSKEIPEGVKLLVAPDAVDSSVLEETLSQSEARSQCGLNQESRRIVVYCGHLYSGRGIELIINLAGLLQDHYFVLLGGREKEVAHYRNLTANIPNLRFLGFQPPAKVFPYLVAADVLLMPHSQLVHASGGGDISAYMSPLKMFEYMAARRPILASDLPVIREVLQQEKNALLLPPDQPTVWLEALKRIQNDLDFADRIAIQAYNDVVNRTWKNRAKLLLDTFAI